MVIASVSLGPPPPPGKPLYVSRYSFRAPQSTPTEHLPPPRRLFVTDTVAYCFMTRERGGLPSMFSS